MTVKNQFRNYCIKTIKNNHYVYSWSYRPKILRTNKRPQRFFWKYRGRYNSEQAQKFIKTLSPEVQLHIQEDYEQRLIKQEVEQEIIRELELSEPFRTEKKNIESIRNRHSRMRKLKIFKAKLKILAETELKQLQ